MPPAILPNMGLRAASFCATPTLELAVSAELPEQYYFNDSSNIFINSFIAGSFASLVLK